MLNNVKILISLTSLIFSSVILSQSLPFDQLQQLETLQQSMQNGNTQGSDIPNNIQPPSENKSLKDDKNSDNEDDLKEFFIFKELEDFTFAPEPKISDQEIKYFGYDFFDSVPSTYSALEDIPVPQDYILGPGDELKVILYGNKNNKYSLVITRDGEIFIQDIVKIAVEGLQISADSNKNLIDHEKDY